LTRNKRERTVTKESRRSIAAAVVCFFDLLFLSSLSLSPVGPAAPLSSAAVPPRRTLRFLTTTPNLRKTETKISNHPGLPASLQRLTFAGRPVSSDEDSLALVGVAADSTLHCSLALLGGGKKRKKKTYTKPKKQKHKHRKVKLGVLKFFKVDDGGKVERLRQTCPQCGPATFMAKHFDRVYCGKCHVTYMVEGGAAGGKSKKK
jgi:small subunit ribosomal protein S27Ae